MSYLAGSFPNGPFPDFESDRALARRLCRYLLLTPLLTIPLTLLLGAGWFDGAVPLEYRRNGDVLLLHLPGLANLYPAWVLLRRRRLGRLPLVVAALGLLSYVVPNVLWLLSLHAWRLAPPVAFDPRLVFWLATQSGLNSLVLWILILTWHGSLGEEDRPA